MNPLVLIILDGWGIAEPSPGNAVSLAKTPAMDMFKKNYPYLELEASGEYVGLPKGVAGNTEVGHLTIGAGRIVDEDLQRINKDIQNNAFFTNKAFLDAIEHAKKNNTKLHILGLVGTGVVHASVEHLFALLQLCKKQEFHDVYLHVFTDGRDSPPQEGINTVATVLQKLKELGVGTIASVSGRYYPMDRDKRWERVEKAYDALVNGKGNTAPDALSAIQNSYNQGVTDEFIEPCVITKEDGSPVATIQNNDSVIFYNFRTDRPRELSKLLLERLTNLFFVTMTNYTDELHPSAVAYPKIAVENTIAEVVAKQGYKQYHLAETEKQRFITYYLDGQHEEPNANEEWMVVPSKKVPTYDMYPKMSAQEITDLLIEKIQSKEYNFIAVNYANPDMVGHTGKLKETIEACEFVDTCLNKVYEEALKNDYSLIITADHGNAEQKINLQTHGVSTQHTSNRVPGIFINKSLSGKTFKQSSNTASIANISPTALELMGVPAPSEMSASLLSELQQ